MYLLAANEVVQFPVWYPLPSAFAGPQATVVGLVSNWSVACCAYSVHVLPYALVDTVARSIRNVLLPSSLANTRMRRSSAMSVLDTADTIDVTVSCWTELAPQAIGEPE